MKLPSLLKTSNNQQLISTKILIILYIQPNSIWKNLEKKSQTVC